jgi:Glycosyl hydrolase family 63 C-terminal domain
VFGCTATATIQTPLLALAWERVAQQSGQDDPDFATEALGQLRLHYDWLARERDPDDDGLLTIILPDESGLDDSPKYDGVYGWMRHDQAGYFWLIERYRRLGYDVTRIAERYDEHVEDVAVNTFYALALRALARLDEDNRTTYEDRASRTEQALIDRCYDESTGLFFDLAGRQERPITTSTWSSLAPLALTEIPHHIRQRLVEEHLLNPKRYRTPCGIPSVSQEEPTFNPGFSRWRCWRGPAWMNTAWLLVPAMRELGYHAEAERVTESLEASVDRHGYREYYNPLTGRGLAARGFGFATLLVDLLAHSEPEAVAPSAARRMMAP